MLDVGETEEVAVLGSSQGSAAMVTCSLGWVSLAAYWAAGLAGGAVFLSAWADGGEARTRSDPSP